MTCEPGVHGAAARIVQQLLPGQIRQVAPRAHIVEQSLQFFDGLDYSTLHARELLQASECALYQPAIRLDNMCLFKSSPFCKEMLSRPQQTQTHLPRTIGWKLRRQAERHFNIRRRRGVSCISHTNLGSCWKSVGRNDLEDCLSVISEIQVQNRLAKSGTFQFTGKVAPTENGEYPRRQAAEDSRAKHEQSVRRDA